MKPTLFLAGLLGLSVAAAAAAPVDLRCFDGRASTLLARLKEAGLTVHRLVDVADIRVPADLKKNADPKEIVEAVAKASNLKLDWIDGKTPLLWRAMDGARQVRSADDVLALSWSADRNVLKHVLENLDYVQDKEIQRAAAELVLRFGRAAGLALLDRPRTEKLVRLALSDDDWLLRRQAVIAAADIGFADAADIVAKAAQDKHLEVRKGAALAAGRLPVEKAEPILAALVAAKPEDKAGLGDYQAVCYAATYGCIKLGAQPGGAAKAVAVLRKIHDGNDGYLAAWAARAAGYVNCPESLKLLTDAANSKDSRVWRGAAIGLGNLRQDGAVAVLKDLLNRPQKGALLSDNAAAISLGMQCTADSVSALLEAEKTKPDLAEVRYGLWLSKTDAIPEPPSKLDTSPLKVADVTATVRTDRPRVFLRKDNSNGWAGPSVAKLRANFRRPDYQRLERKDKLPRTMIGAALLWLASGDELAGIEATALLSDAVIGGMQRARGDTPSYAGISVQRVAAVYDWLHDHGDFDATSRRLVRDHLNSFAGDYLNNWLLKNNSTVFYSRRWGCLASVGVTGAALFGETAEARAMLEYTCRQFRGPDGLGSIRQAQDGGAAGATYALHHAFTDNANVVAAICSATDFDAAASIAETQGDWLRKQMYFQMYYTFPDGNFFKDGDVWAGATDRDQYRMQIDTITNLYKDGVGRTYADKLAARYPKFYPSDYHTEFVWQFFVFNDPDVKPEPLSKLPRAMLFSKDIDGYVFWRSSWDDDATIVGFRCGDAIDMHGSADMGKFMIYKHRILAGKNGAYVGYGSAIHNYYKSSLSANVVVFDDGKNGGRQPSYTNQFGGVGSYEEFKSVRSKAGSPPPGRVVLHEANEKFARVVGLLDAATPDKGEANKWTREMVFLGYRYLLVLDRVKLAAGTKCRWQINADVEPKIDGMTIQVDNAPGRLFCQTLLPKDAAFRKVGGENAPRVMGKQWTVEVTGPDPAAGEQVFLHVLLAGDEKADKMPACSLRADGGNCTVNIDGMNYTFKAE